MSLYEERIRQLEDRCKFRGTVGFTCTFRNPVFSTGYWQEEVNIFRMSPSANWIFSERVMPFSGSDYVKGNLSLKLFLLTR